MKKKNTGAEFEEEVYKLICDIIGRNEFMVSFPNVRIRRKPKYYSKDRDAEIEFDVSVEKYLKSPDENKGIKPSIIVVIECKDYSKRIPVDDVEEFHAKLQQIGADNTKGMVITKNGFFQKSAVSYAESKGIALARMELPNNTLFLVTQHNSAISFPIIGMAAFISMWLKERKRYISYKCYIFTREECFLEEYIFKLFS